MLLVWPALWGELPEWRRLPFWQDSSMIWVNTLRPFKIISMVLGNPLIILPQEQPFWQGSCPGREIGLKLTL